MLNAARSDGFARHIVKDLFRAGDLGYLCSVDADQDGHVVRRDNLAVVNHWVLLKVGGSWKSVALFTGFAETQQEADCDVDIDGEQRLPVNEAELGSMLEGKIRFQIMEGLKWGRRVDIDTRLEGFLRAHMLLRDFSVEHAKGELHIGDAFESPASGEEAYLGACHNEKNCLASRRASLAALRKAQADTSVSSLVWDNCRADDFAGQAQCIAKYRALAECRAGMMYYRDAESIDRCLRSMVADCHRLYPGKEAQLTHCGG